MIFTVVLYFPWCRHLESFREVKSLLYADNLNGASSDDENILETARFTNTKIRLFGQTPAPSKCILLGTFSVVKGACE